MGGPLRVRYGRVWNSRPVQPLAPGTALRQPSGARYAWGTGRSRPRGRSLDVDLPLPLPRPEDAAFGDDEAYPQRVAMTISAFRALRAAACAAALLTAADAEAQALPSEPFTFGNGRVVLGGDAAVSVAPEDEGFFNYSDYEQTTLRQVRFGMNAFVRVSDRISVLGELRSENFDYVTPFALYARIHPLPDRRLDVQIGRIPPTFGSFSRRSYGHDSPLIGSPIAYQYLTSLRPDSAPADLDELVRMRGRGWLSAFSVGDRVGHRGVPLVSAFTWDTGIQVSAGWNMVTGAVAVTNGTPSNPRVSDDNAGKQVSFRTTVTPATGLTFGTSYAR